MPIRDCDAINLATDDRGPKAAQRPGLHTAPIEQHRETESNDDTCEGFLTNSKRLQEGGK